MLSMNSRLIRISAATLALVALLGVELFFNLKNQPTQNLVLITVSAVVFHVIVFEAVQSRSRGLHGLVWLLVVAISLTLFWTIDREPASWAAVGLAVYTILLIFVLKHELHKKSLEQ